MWPLVRAGHVTVFDRVGVYVIDVTPPIVLIAGNMLPEAALPDTLFTLGVFGWIDLAGRQARREFAFDDSPSAGEIRLTLRQAPDGVQMVGKHHNGVDFKRMPCHAKTERLP